MDQANVVLVQWVGVSKPREGAPLAVLAAKSVGAKLHTVWLIGDDSETGRALIDGLARALRKQNPTIWIGEALLTVTDSPDDPSALRRALCSGPKTVRWWQPKGGAKDTRPNIEDLPASIVQGLAAKEPKSWQIVISCASGTPAKIAVLLAELSDARVDHAQSSHGVVHQIALLRWHPGAAMAKRPDRFVIQPIDSAGLSDNALGASRRTRDAILSMAPVGVPVLLLGETGVGKTTVAESLHRLWWSQDAKPSSRREMVHVNCAVLEPSLAAAELFGAKRGAFTDAKHDRLGHFRTAASAKHGTLFLDEVAELPALTQAKLLTALEAKPATEGTLCYRVTAVGASASDPIAVEQLRIVLATNRSVTTGDLSLRDDLVARVGRLAVRLPSLREMRAWIALWTLEALEAIAPRVSARDANGVGPKIALTDGAFSKLLDYAFDPARVWAHNHRDVERLALSLAFAVRRHAKTKPLRGRDGLNSDEIDAVIFQIDREHEHAQSGALRGPASDWTVSTVQWIAPVPETTTAAVRAALDGMTLGVRYEATLLLHAWEASQHNAAEAWRLLTDLRAFATGRGAHRAKNASSAFVQRWKRVFGAAGPVT